MAGENTDANLGLADSSTASNIPDEVQTQPTPAGAQPASEKNQGQEEGSAERTPFHEHPRWKELMAERAEDRRKLAELQAQLASKEQPAQNPVDKYVEKFKSKGVNEENAKLLAEVGVEMAREAAEARVTPVEVAAKQREIDEQFDSFAKAHEDYNELQPRIFEVFKSLPLRLQDALGENPKVGIQFLYDHVKQLGVEEEKRKSYKQGVQDGYQSKKLKQAAAPTGGASVRAPGRVWSDEEIANMDMKTYLAHKSEIFAQRGMR